MPVFAAVFSRSADGWTGTEVDLADLDGIDDVADLMRDVAAAADADGTAVVLLAEADDEWFGIVRIDDTDDPRPFLSDLRVVHSHPVARLFLESDDRLPDADGEPEGTGQTPYPDPVGDTELLADLGTPGAELLALTLREGVLPADALATVADRAGFAEPLDGLRT